MGEAIIARTVKHYRVSVSEKDPARRAHLKKAYKVSPKDFDAVVNDSDILVLAVKPQDFEGVVYALKGSVDSRNLIVSIAAGITTKYIERLLGGKIRIIRTMPNMPAMVGEGITAVCKGKYATAGDVKTACKLFNHVGETLVVKEDLVDAITAVSGSGPAYVFLFMESLIKAAQSLGLKEAQAIALVNKTFSGSIRLILEKGLKPAELRAKVTSKGGTTQAATDVFMKYGIHKIIEEALKAAQKRAGELAKK